MSKKTQEDRGPNNPSEPSMVCHERDAVTGNSGKITPPAIAKDPFMTAEILNQGYRVVPHEEDPRGGMGFDHRAKP